MNLQPQHLIMLRLAPWEVTRFVVILGKTNNLANESRGNMVRTHTYYICTPAAYEGCETPLYYVSLTMI